tara:strand:- start:711 stop:917 length:207 start_codon:yes stop_codon:yes gene_type:complete
VSCGRAHITCSLRQSSLCFQILKTGGEDLFGLAKNSEDQRSHAEKIQRHALITADIGVYQKVADKAGA